MNRKRDNRKLTENVAVNEDILELVAKWKIPEFSHDFAEMIASLYRLSRQDPRRRDRDELMR